jgi:hypothetical protein
LDKERKDHVQVEAEFKAKLELSAKVQMEEEEESQRRIRELNEQLMAAREEHDLRETEHRKKLAQIEG